MSDETREAQVRATDDTTDVLDEIAAPTTDSADGRDPAASAEVDDAPPSQEVVAAPPKVYYASVFPGPGQPIPPQLVELIHKVEAHLKMPVWLLIQSQPSFIDETVVEQFLAQRAHLPKDQPIALLIDSPGGYARSAYMLAKLLDEKCGGFVAVVPRFAKSAATLLTLGGRKIILGKHAELGPLDVQIFDAEYEDFRSGLDQVQSVERLHAAALESVDQTLILWSTRTNKKLETLLPTACHFVSELMQPLFDKIDTVTYTQKSRQLKEAEEYAIRLLEGKYRPEKAKEIARLLVEQYPEHGFIIDAKEAGKIGLNLTVPDDELQEIFDTMRPYLRRFSVMGRLEESNHDEQEC